MSDDRELVERLAAIDATPRASWVAELRADLDAAWETGEAGALRTTTVALEPAPAGPIGGRRWPIIAIAITAAALVLVVTALVVVSGGDGIESTVAPPDSVPLSTSAQPSSVATTDSATTAATAPSEADTVPNPVLAEAAGTALLVTAGAGGGPVVVVDLATGIRVKLPGFDLSESFDPSLFGSFTETAVVGGMAVLFHGSTATAVPLDGSGEPVPLGEADMAFGFPDDGLVLLVRSPPERMTATAVDVTGRVVTPAFELPEGVALPVAVTSLGLLVSGLDGGTYLVSPRSGAVERLPIGSVIAAASTMVVHEICDDQLVCTIHRTDLASGADVVVPADVPVFPSRVSLSPDGRWLAAFSSDFGATLRLIDTTTGEARELAAPDGLFWLGEARWSPSGDWLFGVAERELYTSTDVLVAVRASDGRVVRTATETAAVMAAVPSPFPPR